MSISPKLIYKLNSNTIPLGKGVVNKYFKFTYKNKNENENMRGP